MTHAFQRAVSGDEGTMPEPFREAILEIARDLKTLAKEKDRYDIAPYVLHNAGFLRDLCGDRENRTDVALRRR